MMVRSHRTWYLLLLLLTDVGWGGGWGGCGTVMWVVHTHITVPRPPPPHQRLLIVVIIKTTDDEISPSLRNRINLISTNTLSDENLMMAGIGRNM